MLNVDDVTTQSTRDEVTLIDSIFEPLDNKLTRTCLACVNLMTQNTQWPIKSMLKEDQA